MIKTAFTASDAIWVTHTEKQGGQVVLSGVWEVDASARNLYRLAKSYDFVAEFLQSYSLAPLRRQLLSGLTQYDKHERIVRKELAKSIDRGDLAIPSIMNCAHLACEFALKQFHVRAAYCDGNYRIHEKVPPGLFFPATHSISNLFDTLPPDHQKTIQEWFAEWQANVAHPFNLSTQFKDVIAKFSEEQMEIRYNTIEDADNEVWIAVTTISRFLCRGMSDW